uniref:NADH dehydrogenase subunit 2 n=1 Tax=Euhemisphaerius bistriatus TaxID=3081096 RepID=UPI002E799BAB|nr:NADH dehydrogenase subunit 2 [Epyhemisphaerius bistriatus]WQB38517.1 NADH dehydrogenase subunit 2 [Epyhemisphaerius bistriatus]
MKINLSKLMFLLLTVNSTIMIVSSNNIMMTWVSMEINMISFLPILTKSKKSIDQPMKYFIVQSVSSSLMLMSMLKSSVLEETPNSSMILTASMLMKMGMMPFHLWLPPLMQKNSWENCLIMSTIQSIPPTTVMAQMTDLKLMILPMMLSSIVGPISALKQFSMKKIMAYSSIANSTWMISAMFISKYMFLMFFSVYSTLTILLMKKLKNNNIMYLNQISTMSNIKKVNLSTMMLSLSGIPPLLGFFPKWVILKTMIKFSTIIPMTMLMSSAISTFIYIKMTSPMMMSMSMIKKTKKETLKKNMTLMINLIGIPVVMTLSSF